MKDSMNPSGDPFENEEATEVLLDNIETILSLAISALDVASFLYKNDIATVYPDEANATYQCRKDLGEVATSVRRRREDGPDYEQPKRISELNDRLKSDE